MNIENLNKFVINLPERKERLERSLFELQNYFLNNQPYIVEGVIDKPIHKGIAQAHINAIKMAIGIDATQPIMIIEDDVNFVSNSKDYINDCFKNENLPHDWDILLSSIYNCGKLIKYNDHWHKIETFFCGLTCYVINPKCFEKIINFEKNKHIDRAMIESLNLNCYVSNKFWAIQHNGFSDNVKKYVNYDHLLKKFKMFEAKTR